MPPLARPPPPSIEDFASRPQIEDVSISPDGRYLALIRTLRRQGAGFVWIAPRQGPGSPMRPRPGRARAFQIQLVPLGDQYAPAVRTYAPWFGKSFVYGVTRLGGRRRRRQEYARADAELRRGAGAISGPRSSTGIRASAEYRAHRSRRGIECQRDGVRRPGLRQRGHSRPARRYSNSMS